MYDVFISYSRKDRDFVFRVTDHLADDNLTCQIDTKDIHPPEVWRNEIKDAIIDADNFLFVISPDSNDSEHYELLELLWNL